ncbi:PTS mannose/fructose/sorbose/N-acetylgalactosamine transporter subunit IIC [Sporofaciens musculi]|uniref:PTS mannose/fructose/sorbose/N-acetylgalactosamine transporter subunit IIC n=1 Tax=Sporofaciens musculi TaxID=2681861 RepID=UPI002570C9C4|nr:PTS sugar transporter subunit IIC [Sporofaciens musculi]
MTVWTEALLIGMIVGLANWLCNGIITRTQFDSPLIVCPLVGIVMGDFQQGVILGAALQLLFIGAFSVGNAIPPNQSVASALAAAFAIKMGMGAEVALGLAMPIGIIAAMLQNIIFSLVSIPTRMIDNAAAQGNTRKIGTIFLLNGFFVWVVLLGGITALTYAFGVDAVQAAVNAIPQFVLDGMSAAAGIIPAVGIGLLLKMVYKGYLIPYFFLGYILAAYMGLPVLGIVLLGLVLVFVKMDFRGMKAAAGTITGDQEVEDDDF